MARNAESFCISQFFEHNSLLIRRILLLVLGCGNVASACAAELKPESRAYEWIQVTPKAAFAPRDGVECDADFPAVSAEVPERASSYFIRKLNAPDKLTLHESQIADRLGAGVQTWDETRSKLRRIVHNRRRLRDEAGDYIGAVFSILREMGLPVVASIRMNDAHMGGDPPGPLAAQFSNKHPEWRLGAPYGYYSSCLTYAVPEARD